MKNYKTTNWFKIVIDQIDWYYNWNDVKNRFEEDLWDEEFERMLYEKYKNSDFRYYQVYGPRIAYFEEESLKDSHIVYYDYMDWWTFFLDKEQVIDWLPDRIGDIIEDSESKTFEAFELINKTDN